MEDKLVPGRIGATQGPVSLRTPDAQYRAARSCLNLCTRASSFNRGLGLLLQLVLFKEIAPRAKLLVYSAMESAASAFWAPFSFF